MRFPFASGLDCQAAARYHFSLNTPPTKLNLRVDRKQQKSGQAVSVGELQLATKTSVLMGILS
jgi:hypothetical protein